MALKFQNLFFLRQWFPFCSVLACDTPEKDVFCRGCYGKNEVQYSAVQGRAGQCSAVQCSALHCTVMPCCVMLRCVVQWCAFQYSAMPYSQTHFWDACILLAHFSFMLYSRIFQVRSTEPRVTASQGGPGDSRLETCKYWLEIETRIIDYN